MRLMLSSISNSLPRNLMRARGIGRQRTRNHDWHTDEDGKHEGIAQVEQPVPFLPTVGKVLEG